MNRRFRLSLVLGLATLTVCVGFLGVQGYTNVARLIKISDRVEQSRLILSGLQEVLSLLRDAESSQRGYLLTGRPSYLDSYDGSHLRVLALIGAAGRQVVGTPRQREAVRWLAEATRAKFAEMDETIELARTGRRADALALVLTDRGERLMNESVALSGRVEQIERGLLDERRLQAAAHASGSLTWLLSLMGGTLLMVIGLCGEIVRETRVRQRTEGVLRESEERFRGSFEAAAIGMALVAPDGRFLKVNRALLESTGYTEDELLARDFQSITHPDDLDADLTLFGRILVGEIRSYRMDKRYIHKGGRIIHIVLGVSIVPDHRGRPLHLVAQIEDVTARVLAERDAREERRFIENIADASPSMLYLFDLRTQRNVWANARFVDIMGYTLAEVDAMEGTPVEAIVHPDDLPAIAEHQAKLRAAADGEVCEVEYRTRHRDGLWRRLRSRDLVFHRDADGRALQVVGSGVDVTERHRAEADLARVQSRLADAIESLDAGLVMYDAEDRLVVCNRRYRELYTHAAEEMTPGTPYETILRAYYQAQPPPADGPSIDELVAARLAEHHNRRGVYEQPVGDGWVRIGDFPTADGGVVSLRTDITALKRTEDDLRRARDDARAAARAKAEFLANMSHEIRTPMNGVLGMAELALGTALSARQREYFDTIHSSAESLLTVIDDILDFSKVESGKLRLDRTPFALRNCLDDTLHAFAPRAHEKGLELCVRVRSGVPEVLVGDPHRLRQVLVNLVGNAIKFTPRGEVVVAVETVTDPRADDGDDHGLTLAFTVADTGIGIPADRRAAIFDPFEQADGSTTRKYGGTGLGLAISSKLVALMGGSIGVESRDGGGSRFRFTATFGRPTSDQARLFTSPTSLPALAGRPVLILDDNATSRAMLSDMMNHWAVESTSVADVPAAIEAIRLAVALGRPLAALLVDGEAAARAIAATATEAGVPLILLTSDHSDRPPGGNPPAATRLAKPVRQTNLHAALAALSGENQDPAETPAPLDGPAYPPRSLRVLLAEDNSVNQVVATQMLERLGHRPEVVNNGVDALKIIAKNYYDIAIMDIQMPELDGFQAVAELRAREEGVAGSRRTPVVALTAHAMSGDRERCLAAGFDAYLSKPIRLADLAATLDRLASPAGSRLDHSAIPSVDPSPAAFRPEALAEACGGVAETEADVLDSFLAEAPTEIDRIRLALSASDHRAARGVAHSLRGACLTVGAEVVAEVCARLEALGDAPPDPSFQADLGLAWNAAHTSIVAHREALGLALVRSRA